MKSMLFCVSMLILLMGCDDEPFYEMEDDTLIDNQREGNLNNLSFETSLDWENLTSWTYPYYAPVNGEAYAIVHAHAATTKKTGILLEAGKTYTLKVWSRSVYTEEKTRQFRDAEIKPNGTNLRSVASIRLTADGQTIAETSQDVSPPVLQGSAATVSNDDGANVFLDGGFRMQITERVFAQPGTANPVTDPWTSQGLVNLDYDGLAPAPYMGSGTLNYLYACDYVDGQGEELTSSLDYIKVSGSAPDYVFDYQNREVIFGHEGSEFPWVIDPQPFKDESTGRLWMVWGGNMIWISELDPATGHLLEEQESLEITTHDEGVHTPIASAASTEAVGATQNIPENWAEAGDGWSSGYTEGASVYEYNGFYYLFSSYGNLGTNYTIRMGRSENPTGPYLDKNGRNLLTFYPEIDYYGHSFLLGNDGNQLVPGHPHVWEESGTFYLGYDYRTDISDPDVEFDLMGIRKLYWEDGWPTVWTPIILQVNADDFPEKLGEELQIELRNSGDSRSVVAYDHLSLEEN